MEWSLVFKGISSACAIVNAAKSALEARRITREELLEAAKEAEDKAIADISRAEQAAKEIAGLDTDIEIIIREKIEKTKQHWSKRVRESDDQAEWAEATDRLQSDQCALLRLLKQLNRGRLPGEWYQLWADLRCS